MITILDSTDAKHQLTKPVQDHTSPRRRNFRLDAMTVPFVAYAAAARIVNGPEGDVLAVNRHGRTMYGGYGQRIFTATRDIS